jgi:GxxExxY protein
MKDQKTYKIIGAAMEVHKELGCGFLEAIDHEALIREFSDQGIPFNPLNPQISQITRITLITLRAMRNLQGLIPRSLL